MPIDLHALGLVAGLYAAGLLIPGPNLLVVAHRALHHGRSEALVTVMGVVAANAVWASSSLFGLSVAFTLFPRAFLAMKLLGAAYLVWSGVKLWRQAGRPAGELPDQPAASGWAAAFRAGLATSLSNAKSMVFYASAFSAVAPSPDKTATLWAGLLIVLALATLWYGLVAVALSTSRAGLAYARSQAAVARVCGTVMVLFGLRLATDV